ncbi:MAG TPA: hypothetical protein DCE80_03440, partial [Ignavibacteriales bacterium]|nr:hypothetical protein [Ignavibacteriales bacterium]
NYPNPFNASTKIQYSIPALSENRSRLSNSVRVVLKVFNMLGEENATLVNEEKLPGNYEIEFSASSGNSLSSARHLSSGIYYYRLQAGDFSQTKKMVLVQ